MKYYLVIYKNGEFADCNSIEWLKMLTNFHRITKVNIYETNESHKNSILLETFSNKRDLRKYIKRYKDEDRKI